MKKNNHKSGATMPRKKREKVSQTLRYREVTTRFHVSGFEVFLFPKTSKTEPPIFGNLDRLITSTATNSTDVLTGEVTLT